MIVLCVYEHASAERGISANGQQLLTRIDVLSTMGPMESPAATAHAERGSPWRGILLIVVVGLLLGLGPAGLLIGVGLVAFVLDKTAPKKLDELIDFLTF